MIPYQNLFLSLNKSCTIFYAFIYCDTQLDKKSTNVKVNYSRTISLYQIHFRVWPLFHHFHFVFLFLLFLPFASSKLFLTRDPAIEIIETDFTKFF